MTSDSNQAAQPKKKMGCFKIGGIIVLVIFGLAILGSIFGDGKTQSETVAQDAPSAPPIETTARELESAYAANEAAAQQKYGGRALLVRGTIRSINLGIGDEPFLVLAGSNPFTGPQAELGDASKSKAAELAKGQKIELHCQSVSEIVGTPMLKDCEIQ